MRVHNIKIFSLQRLTQLHQMYMVEWRRTI